MQPQQPQQPQAQAPDFAAALAACGANPAIVIVLTTQPDGTINCEFRTNGVPLLVGLGMLDLANKMFPALFQVQPQANAFAMPVPNAPSTGTKQ